VWLFADQFRRRYLELEIVRRERAELSGEQSSLPFSELAERLGLVDAVTLKEFPAPRAAPAPLARQELADRPAARRAGGARITSAADTSPSAIRRLSSARASRTSLARSSARSRCGPGVMIPVSGVMICSAFRGLSLLWVRIADMVDLPGRRSNDASPHRALRRTVRGPHPFRQSHQLRLLTCSPTENSRRPADLEQRTGKLQGGARSQQRHNYTMDAQSVFFLRCSACAEVDKPRPSGEGYVSPGRGP